MAYRLKLKESVKSGIRRAGLEQLERVRASLSRTDDIPTGVHDARKALKRTRALLRLLRPALPAERYQADNARLRDIGQLLSGSRDRHVMVRTISTLIETASARERAALERLRTALGDTHDQPPATIAEAIAKLDDATAAMRSITATPPTIATVLAGARMSYKAGRKAFAAFEAEPTDEAVHDLRKCVQQHWRHMIFLREAWPELMQARAKTARNLSDLLGDDHDLAVLAAFAASADAGLSNEDASVIDRACRQSQQAIRRSARMHCLHLFGDRPRDLERRLGEWWSASATSARENSRADRKAGKSLPASRPPVPSADEIGAARHGSLARAKSRGEKTPVSRSRRPL